MPWSSLVPHVNNCLKFTHRPTRHPGSFSLCRTWTHTGGLDKDHSQWGSDVKIQWFLLRNSEVSLSLFSFGIVSLFLFSASLLMFSLSSLPQMVISSVRGFSILIKKNSQSLCLWASTLSKFQICERFWNFLLRWPAKSNWQAWTQPVFPYCSKIIDL